MMYQDILQRIENEKKDEIVSTKLYRYTGLVQAIDYFSQKLVFDQIIDAAFDFINELLLVEKSVIYVIDKDTYCAKKVKGFTQNLGCINTSHELQNLATFSGNILTVRETITKYFDANLVDELNINSVVPLIIEGNLYGFILFYSNHIGEDDYIISESLMRLINNALENFSRYEKLAKANTALDEKIFNLFAINQSSKVLLSELRIDVLYSISVDVFSELTRSKITGFVLFDDRADRYLLKAFKDVFYKINDVIVDLSVNKDFRVNPNKVIIELSNEQDYQYMEGLFPGAGLQLSELEAKYVVLILKNDQILGFVTLSETVTGSEYGDGIFELIESLSSSMYISLSNAKLFQIVNEQKAVIQNKLNKLISLNNLSKNISSSLKIDTLLEMCIKTLQISFNVEKGAFCLYKKDTHEFEFVKAINMEHMSGAVVAPNSEWKRVFEGDSIFAVGHSNVSKYFGEEFAEKIGETQGVLIIPVYIDMMDIEMLGAITVFAYDDLLLDNEENLLIMETIAGNIAPVLNNLLLIQMQQRFMLPNYIELFKNDLKEEIKTAQNYNIDLTIVQIEDERDFLFKGNSVIESLKSEFKKVYPFSYNNIFIMENCDSNDLEERIKRSVNASDLKVKKMVLGKDFRSFAEFFELYR